MTKVDSKEANFEGLQLRRGLEKMGDKGAVVVCEGGLSTLRRVEAMGDVRSTQLDDLNERTCQQMHSRHCPIQLCDLKVYSVIQQRGPKPSNS